jgi:hypothetical protein
MFGAVAAHYVDAAAPVGYDATVLASSPLRYYKFQETSGTTLIDYSPSGINGTVIGSPTMTGDGYTFLNSGSQKIDIGITGLPRDNSPYSAEFIVTPNTTSGAHDVVDWGQFGTTNAVTACGQNNATYWNYWNGSNVPTGSVITSGHTDHVVMTYDQANVRIYVQGVLKVTTARSGHAVSTTTGGANIGISLGDTAPYSGTIKRVAIYGSALSGTTVTNLYNAAHTDGIV